MHVEKGVSKRLHLRVSLESFANSMPDVDGANARKGHYHTMRLDAMPDRSYAPPKVYCALRITDFRDLGLKSCPLL